MSPPVVATLAHLLVDRNALDVYHINVMGRLVTIPLNMKKTINRTSHSSMQKVTYRRTGRSTISSLSKIFQSVNQSSINQLEHTSEHTCRANLVN